MPVIEGNKVNYGNGVHYVAVLEYTLNNLSNTQTRVNYTLRLRHTGSLYDTSNNAGASGDLKSAAFGSINYSRPSANSYVYESGYRTFTRNPSDRTISQTFWVEGLADGSGGGARSTVSVNITIPRNPSGPPNTPNTPTVSSITQSSAKINMVKPANNGSAITITGFYLSESASGAIARSYGSSAASTSHTFTGLAPNKDYWAYVRAYNAHGWSGYSTRRKFTTKALVAPNAPAAPTFSAIGDQTFTATVTPPATNGATITGYQFQVAESSGMSPVVIDSTDSTASRVLASSSLVPGGRYYVRVRVSSNNGPSGWSPVASVVLTSSGPPRPEPPQYLGQIGTAARLSLPEPTPGTGATEIQVSLRSSPWVTQLTVVGRDDDVLALDTEVGREYLARIREQDGDGVWSEWSTVERFTPANHMGIYINDGGVWVPGELYENVGGTWVRQELWVNQEGSWQPIV